MKIEGIYSEKVKKFLERHYLIKVKEIDYFPIGEDGASYIIKTRNKKYYCKVYNKFPIAYASIRKIKITMDFLFCINKRFGFQNAPLPVKNKHRNVISKFKGHPVVLYNYINGRNLRKLSKEDYKKLGRILANLHLINKKHFPKIKNEKIDLEWEKRILKSIKELKKGRFHKDSNCGVLKKVILGNEGIFLKGISFLEKRVKYIHKKRKNYIISHNDLHWGNLMKGDDRIFLLDWDGLELALPEKDLMFFLKGLKMNNTFWKEYISHRKHKIDKKALEYYVVRRLFSDITFFSRVILHTRVEKKRFKEYIKEIKSDINFLKRLEKVIGG
ncbi:MAG: phosphotransferase [archaeon]